MREHIKRAQIRPTQTGFPCEEPPQRSCIKPGSLAYLPVNPGSLDAHSCNFGNLATQQIQLKKKEAKNKQGQAEHKEIVHCSSQRNK